MLFLADFPDESRRHEGMSQRMIAIDSLCEQEHRTYLFVSYRLYWRMETRRISHNATQYRCNMFKHFFLISRLLRQADILYFHSVINVLPLLPFLCFIRKQSQVVLDAHGVVPEELLHTGKTMKGKLYQLAERSIFGRVNKVITVSDAMAVHFSRKYPRWDKSYLKYPILPSHISVADLSNIRELGDEQTHVLYSGNLQAWQNIDLMIRLIKNNRSAGIQYTIMTGQPVEMTARLAAEGIRVGDGIAVLTVSPNELQRYYRKAHYGFILRDDMLINRVACPTKLVEYLYYGIIPIVKSSKIGDFKEMGYEYVSCENLSDGLPARKSHINAELVSRYMAETTGLDFKKLIGRER
ncbi:hypothetical protein GCM10007415_17640 [Parapedobacter pyrenivorans]|uniref:Uncharacterized protein n=2 Tax=Parapedobacter pyrenivorans TaxID=1305674 RepID=A0A917HN15_9SPHI|nr:hypothetical protein GCM10007415_17640 [Parapedobacter pyrenivorans]